MNESGLLSVQSDRWCTWQARPGLSCGYCYVIVIYTVVGKKWMLSCGTTGGEETGAAT